MGPQPLFIAAAASYTANCLLGLAVATGAVDTSRIRWVHHALYIATCTLAATAAASAVLPPAAAARAAHTEAARSATAPSATARSAAARSAASRRSALALLPAALPLALIPRVSAHSPRHALLALTAAPFFAASLIAPSITAWATPDAAPTAPRSPRGTD